MNVAIHEGQVRLSVTENEFQTYVRWLVQQEQKVTICCGDPENPGLIQLYLKIGDYLAFLDWQSKNPDTSNHLPDQTA